MLYKLVCFFICLNCLYHSIRGTRNEISKVDHIAERCSDPVYIRNPWMFFEQIQTYNSVEHVRISRLRTEWSLNERIPRKTLMKYNESVSHPQQSKCGFYNIGHVGSFVSSTSFKMIETKQVNTTTYQFLEHFIMNLLEKYKVSRDRCWEKYRQIMERPITTGTTVFQGIIRSVEFN